MLSERVKKAIYASCYDVYASQRELHGDDEHILENIQQLVDMLYDLKLRAYELDQPILALIWEEALEAAGVETKVENPYAISDR